GHADGREPVLHMACGHRRAGNDPPARILHDPGNLRVLGEGGWRQREPEHERRQPGRPVTHEGLPLPSEYRAGFKTCRVPTKRGSTKQKGIASLRCPPAPLIWLPQHSRRPAVIRPATLTLMRATAVPVCFLRKTENPAMAAAAAADDFVASLTKVSAW